MKRIWILMMLIAVITCGAACLEEESSSQKKDSIKTESGIPEIELPEDEF